MSLDISKLDIHKVISSEIFDFEYAVMVETAIHKHHNEKTSIPVYTPSEFLEGHRKSNELIL